MQDYVEARGLGLIQRLNERIAEFSNTALKGSELLLNLKALDLAAKNFIGDKPLTKQNLVDLREWCRVTAEQFEMVDEGSGQTKTYGPTKH